MDTKATSKTTRGRAQSQRGQPADANAAPKTEPIADVAATPPNRPSPDANGAAAFDPWLLTVPAPGMGDYYLCPPDNYPATIIGLIDIGHQLNKFAKEDSTDQVHQIVLVYELEEQRPDGKPFLLSKSYTFSLHEKSNLYKLTSCITGRTFRQDEEFSVAELLGKPAMVSVGNSQSGEKPYHTIDSVTSFPKKMAAPKPVNPLYAYSVSQGGEFRPPFEVPYVFGRSVESLIHESPEYKALHPDDPF
jgi:hypothetical protein